MAEIHVLDQDTINQIAAGEVVERPASVVKELVENAIDAASTAITVEIKGGGVDFIRITDNGFGIEKTEIRKAFLPHATSKIRKADDLVTVASLGFRGEALASIASVARVELVTKTDEGIVGTRFVIEGGAERAMEEVGCPEGTTLIVRDLFYNTPARRKFLKSHMTEAGYVESFLTRLAISHPDISFKLICENKNKIATSGNGSLKDVIYHIFGRDAAMNLLPVADEEHGIRVEGFVGKPSISRGNRNYENYFVNGRYLKNKIISRAIEDGYKGHAMVHKFPFAVLMLSMDAHLFDANVHPAKMEMRFHNEEALYEAVMHAVQKSFLKKDLIPKVSLGEETKKVYKERPPKKMPEPFEEKRRAIEAHFSQLSEERKQEIARRKREDAERDLEENPQEMREGHPQVSAIEAKIKKLHMGENAALKREIDAAIPATKPKENPEAISAENLVENTEEKPEENPRENLEGKPAESPEVKEPETYGAQRSLLDTPLLSEEARPKHRIIGQVFRTYWLVEFSDKLFFVDQHAAHEKVMYEKMKRDLEENTIVTQMIAPPTVLNFTIKEREIYQKCEAAFKKLGFQIEAFGDDAYCIRGVPANLLGLDAQALFVELFDGMDESGSMKLDILTDKLAGMACKAAVKGNSTMSVPEMEALLDQLLLLENPYQCPHGRPTIISMTKYELEKKFKRIQ